MGFGPDLERTRRVQAAPSPPDRVFGPRSNRIRAERPPRVRPGSRAAAPQLVCMVQTLPALIRDHIRADDHGQGSPPQRPGVSGLH